MAEKAYIEREALIEEAKHNKAVCQAIADIVDVKNIINNTPVADVAPVRHGRWIDNKHTDTAICSECKRVFTDETNFCPNCGAKMDEQ